MRRAPARRRMTWQGPPVGSEHRTRAASRSLGIKTATINAAVTQPVTVMTSRAKDAVPPPPPVRKPVHGVILPSRAPG